jgi:hypothetical protein
VIPVGYLYKKVSKADGDLKARNIVDFFSVGTCGAGISPPFTDYISHWKHNGYWLFNSPDIMREIARAEDIDLSSMTLFYYEVYEYELNQSAGEEEKTWMPVQRDPSFSTEVLVPERKVLTGFDVVEYVYRNAPECSLLSCSALAKEFSVNSHCLFDSVEEAKAALETGKFHECEPGPYRLLAVYECL